MARDLKAKIRIEGDAKGATKAIKQTEGGFRRLGKSIKTSALAQVAAIAGIALALRGLVRGMGAVIRAANVQEDAVSELDRALAKLGPTAGAVSEALQKQAAALQQTTTFGDEEIIKAQALIASFVQEEDQIKAATIATLDLAKAKGFDLTTAADLVSKTLGSTTNALTRYGIEVTGAVGSTERLATLTENVANVFGGAAAKATEVFSGKTKQLSNTIGDLQEEMGFAITKSEDIGEAIDDLNTNVQELTPRMAELAEKLVAVTLAVVNGLAKFGELIVVWNQYIGVLDDLDDAQERSVVSSKALKDTAFRLGITVEELELRLTGTAARARDLNDASREAAGGLDAEADSANAAAEATAALEDAAKQTKTAMEELGAALDQVTSAELSAEIVEIETALEAARVATGGVGVEFERLEAIATQEIASIETRIDGLRDGLGDLGDQVDETGERFDDLTGSVDGTNSALSRQASQARTTAGELRSLSAVAQSLALAEARTALAITQAERGRVTGVSSQDPSRGSITGLPVGPSTSKTYIVQPDGTLVLA